PYAGDTSGADVAESSVTVAAGAENG
ncbi:MAG: hypothetical protein QOC85_1645, partial [Streptomyces sp.]|nr:hypothetical protein [Streptomyces sp.]